MQPARAPTSTCPVEQVIGGQVKDPHVTVQAGQLGVELQFANQAIPKPSAKESICEASRLIPQSLERRHLQ